MHITAPELIDESRRHRIPGAQISGCDNESIAYFLPIVLDLLLDAIDYEGDLKSSGAVAARMLAAMAAAAEDKCKEKISIIEGSIQ
jgi:hypothetical protein